MRSAYELVCGRNPDEFEDKFSWIWKTNYVPKIQFFTWYPYLPWNDVFPSVIWCILMARNKEIFQDDRSVVDPTKECWRLAF